MTTRLLNFPEFISLSSQTPARTFFVHFFTLLTHFNSVWGTYSCAPTIIRNNLIVIFYTFLCSRENIFQFPNSISHSLCGQLIQTKSFDQFPVYVLPFCCVCFGTFSVTVYDIHWLCGLFPYLFLQRSIIYCFFLNFF